MLLFDSVLEQDFLLGSEFLRICVRRVSLQLMMVLDMIVVVTIKSWVGRLLKEEWSRNADLSLQLYLSAQSNQTNW